MFRTVIASLVGRRACCCRAASLTSDHADAARAALTSVAADEADQARLYARRMRHRAELDRLLSTGPAQFATIELAGTARIGQVRASTQLTDARRLVEILTGTLGLLEQGVLFQDTAELLLSLTRQCTPQVQAEVEARVLGLIGEVTTTDARPIIERTIPEVEADLDPTLTTERLARARRHRSVWLASRPDAMVQISAEIDRVRGRRWTLDFDELCRAQQLADHTNGVDRTAEQVRADVFAELLKLAQTDPDAADDLEAFAAATTDLSPDHAAAHDLTDDDDVVPEPEPVATARDWLTDLTVEELTIELLRLPVRNQTVLNVHIPMSTVLELDHRAGYVEGLGVVPAQHARMLLPVAGLRRLYVDQASGVPLGLDPHVLPPLTSPEQLALTLSDPDSDPDSISALAQAVRDRLLSMLGPATIADHAQPQHDPNQALTRLVEVRDLRCCGIGCAQPAHRSHKDHELRYPDGPTAAWNLGAKSARCHRAKHAGWTVTRHSCGQITWTSPLGHSYHRPGVWQAPPALPENLTLPAPQLPQPDNSDPHDPPLSDQTDKRDDKPPF